MEVIPSRDLNLLYILLDIGFEELAKQIYYSSEAVEVPERYCKAMELVVKNSRLIAAVKREIINQLNKEV